MINFRIYSWPFYSWRHYFEIKKKFKQRSPALYSDINIFWFHLILCIYSNVTQIFRSHLVPKCVGSWSWYEKETELSKFHKVSFSCGVTVLASFFSLPSSLGDLIIFLNCFITFFSPRWIVVLKCFGNYPPVPL